MGRGRVGKFGFFGPYRSEFEGIPVHIGPMLHIPIISHILSGLWLAWVALKLSNRKVRQIHLFYNQLTFYIPALILLRIFQRTTSVDIEDSPIQQKTSDGLGSRLRISANASLGIFEPCISGGALIANTAIANSTSIRPVLPYYGAVPNGAPVRKPENEVIRILFSGTLEKETGAELLADTLEILNKHEVARFLHFIITGSGSYEFQLKERIKKFSNLNIEFLGRIKNTQYLNILKTSDIGLSLKLINGDYSDTTFPSKTIEFGEFGIYIISTDISDVFKIFENRISYIKDNDPYQIVQNIIYLYQNRKSLRISQHDLSIYVKTTFSYEKSGYILNNFYFGDAD